MQVHKFVKTITTVASAGSGNTSILRGGICRKLFVESATSSTTFKVNITDDTNSTIRSYNARQNILNDEAPLIMVGVNTINITDATANEAFIVKIWLEE